MIPRQMCLVTFEMIRQLSSQQLDVLNDVETLLNCRRLLHDGIAA